MTRLVIWAFICTMYCLVEANLMSATTFDLMENIMTVIPKITPVMHLIFPSARTKLTKGPGISINYP